MVHDLKSTAPCDIKSYFHAWTELRREFLFFRMTKRRHITIDHRKYRKRENRITCQNINKENGWNGKEYREYMVLLWAITSNRKNVKNIFALCVRFKEVFIHSNYSHFSSRAFLFHAPSLSLYRCSKIVKFVRAFEMSNIWIFCI